jgi:SEFIR domain
MTNPKAFISYSWTSPEHQQWVLALATQLRESGVDVIIDKWDLREGHDAIKFMERMVTDPDIKKVIMILNRAYAEKADGRKGGVGTETQIISPEIYAKTDQNKFVGVVSETDADGNSFRPTFYKSRIYIDLSHSDLYATNFEQLLRWIYDKPAHPKPPLGKQPEFLGENAIQLPTGSRARRAVELLKNNPSQAERAIEEYLSVLANTLESFRLDPDKFDIQKFDEQIIQNIDAFMPYRDEFITVASAIAHYSRGNIGRLLHRFFESLIPYLFRPKSFTKPSYEWNWDNFRFIIHEMFLYTVALLLNRERFDVALELMSQGYYVSDTLLDRRDPMQPFSIIYQPTRSLINRNVRLRLNRLSFRADILEQRSHASGLTFMSLMQADFVLFFYDSITSLKEERRPGWWPDTLVYYGEYAPPFEIFARAESLRYFQNVCPLIAVNSKAELADAIKRFGVQDAQLRLPQWDVFHTVSLAQATNFERLVTKP